MTIVILNKTKTEILNVQGWLPITANAQTIVDSYCLGTGALRDDLDFVALNGDFTLYSLQTVYNLIEGALVNISLLPPTVAGSVVSKLSELASLRFQKETGGITVAGVNVLTDRESQATMSGAYISVQLNPARLIKWKGADGAWTQIDKATVEYLASAVADHVEACFNNEAVHSEAIQLLTTVEDVEAYDITTGWPT